jgi:hypothetical protein
VIVCDLSGLLPGMAAKRLVQQATGGGQLVAALVEGTWMVAQPGESLEQVLQGWGRQPLPGRRSDFFTQRSIALLRTLMAELRRLEIADLELVLVWMELFVLVLPHVPTPLASQARKRLGQTLWPSQFATEGPHGKTNSRREQLAADQMGRAAMEKVLFSMIVNSGSSVDNAIRVFLQSMDRRRSRN